MLGELREVRYNIDTDRVLSIAPSGDAFHSTIETIPSHTDEVGVSGEVEGSLFQAVTDAGEKPELAMRLAEIFGWDLDFYTDPRPGDTFRVVVEKKTFANGETAAYGRILAAEYNNAGHAYRAILFRGPSGAPAYYTPDGKSMKKAFLHSPLKFAAPITSHFSLHRFHPILKEYRAHLGIDYGAPTGTPVQTIGDGRVIFAGMKGGDGNLVKVQHTNGYTTYYMHLSRILVRDGQRVEQGRAHRTSRHDRPRHRTASRFPNPAPRAIFEFRAAASAALRPGCHGATGTISPPPATARSPKCLRRPENTRRWPRIRPVLRPHAHADGFCPVSAFKAPQNRPKLPPHRRIWPHKLKGFRANFSARITASSKEFMAPEWSYFQELIYGRTSHVSPACRSFARSPMPRLACTSRIWSAITSS